MVLKACVLASLLSLVAGVWDECSEPCGGGQRSDPTQGWTIDCHSFSCNLSLSCMCGDTDLVFVMDNSGSIGPLNFWVQKQFVVDVVSGLKMHGGSAVDKTRVGLVGFHWTAYEQFGLAAGHSFSNLPALVDAIWATPYVGTWTNTSGGLMIAKDMFETQNQPSNKRVLILVTDGESNKDQHLTIPTADQLKLDLVAVFGIAIGNVNNAEMTGVSSSPTSEFLFHVSNHAALAAIIDDVLEGACCNTNAPECTIYETSVCSQSCDGGVISIKGNCKYFDFDGNLVRTDYTEWTEPCPDITCPIIDMSGCEHRQVLHETGTTWIAEVSDGRKKLCRCPDIPPPPDEWTQQTYCTPFCDDDGTIHLADETYTKTVNGTDHRCRCNFHGQTNCKEVLFFEGCRFGGQLYPKDSEFVITMADDKKKLCNCPAEIDDPADWNTSDYCFYVCVVGGVLQRPDYSFQTLDSKTGLAIECTCNKWGTVMCKNIGCTTDGVFHPPGKTFFLKEGTNWRLCDCPAELELLKEWKIKDNCPVVCRSGGSVYNDGDTFRKINPKTGLYATCQCKKGSIKC